MSITVLSRPLPTTPDPVAAPAPAPAPALPPLPSLADVIAFVEAKPDLPPLRRRDLISALRTAGRLFQRDPASVRAEPRHLRGLFEALSPAACGISAARLTNIRSLTLAVLREAGIRAMPGRALEPLSLPWERLRAQLPDTRFRNGLSRFMSVCSVLGITPDAVDAATFEVFRKALEEQSLNRAPSQVHRTTCVLWNKAGQTIPGWPDGRANVPSLANRYSLEWDAFQTSFREDAAAFLKRSGNQDVLADDYARSVEPSTIQMRRKQILQVATALVRSGFPIEAIDGLTVLVDPTNAKSAIRFLLKRKNDQPTKYLHQQAQLLRTIARHWVRAKPTEEDELAKLVGRLSVKRTGMTDKNRNRLRQFDNSANVRALVNLPRRVLDELGRKDPGDRAGALRAMYALATEVLLIAPIRIDNLVGLEPERHLLRLQNRAGETIHLILSEEETKNDTPYELELPAETRRVLELYLSRYRNRIASNGSVFLFPNETGSRRSTVPFATGLSRFILRETGICMNVHLFRHLAAKLHLEAFPEDIETVRRLLGHRSITTTQRSYIDIKTSEASRRYDSVVAAWREEQAQTPQRLDRKPGSTKVARR